MSKITEMYAWIVDEDGNGDEGIIGLVKPFPTPASTGRRHIAEAMEPMAREVSRLTGRTVRLCMFTHREEIAVITSGAS